MRCIWGLSLASFCLLKGLWCVQKIPAEEAPCLGAAADLGEDQFLVWRVTDCENQQCLELEELDSREEGGSSGRLRVFLDEQIVDVKCLVAHDDMVLLIVTLTSVWCARVSLSAAQPLHLLFPHAFQGGPSRECSWADLHDTWRQVFDAKEGQSVLCSDARFSENYDDVEAFLGTNAGHTVMLSISAQGRGAIKSELRQTSGPGFSRCPKRTFCVCVCFWITLAPDQ